MWGNIHYQTSGISLLTKQTGGMFSNYYLMLIYFLKSNIFLVWLELELPPKKMVGENGQPSKC
jgi:hypothetical protein